MFDLVPHPDTPTKTIERVSVQFAHGQPGEIWIEYHVAPANELSLPASNMPERHDGLWKTTCFELFLRPDGSEAYFEYNLSPSFRWAAYAFDRYRSGMRECRLRSAPEISITPTDGSHFWLSCDLDVPSDNGAIGLSAVIEETDGTKSYWALAHAPGPPDFHDPACFTATLPAPSAA